MNQPTKQITDDVIAQIAGMNEKSFITKPTVRNMTEAQAAATCIKGTVLAAVCEASGLVGVASVGQLRAETGLPVKVLYAMMNCPTKADRISAQSAAMQVQQVLAAHQQQPKLAA